MIEDYLNKVGKLRPRTPDHIKFLFYKPKLVEVHGDRYNYIEVIGDKIKATCQNHGEFIQSLYSHLNGSGCPYCKRETLSQLKTISIDDFINKANVIHDFKYDYSLVDYQRHDIKVKIICPIHGIFEQTPNGHINNAGCKKCGVDARVKKRTLTTESFIEKSNKIHNGSYDYSLVDYKQSRYNIDIICPIHGKFSQRAASHIFNGYGCAKCTNSVSFIELELCKYLNGESNNRKIIPPYEIDIYIKDKNIAVEYNGLYWHSDKFKKNDYHLIKTEMCESKGIQLFHIFEGENIDIWKSVLVNAIGKSKRIFARKTHISYVDSKTANEFLELNHLQGKCNSTVRIGLYENEELLSIMTFGKARYSNAQWELLRFCNKINHTIVGGASKLLTEFRKQHRGSIVSYANRRWSNGNLYEKLGFQFIHNSKPCYWYVKRGEYKLHHRSKFMKHKLSKLYNYNDLLTEKENMKNNEYLRIYDSGNKVYILED